MSTFQEKRKILLDKVKQYEALGFETKWKGNHRFPGVSKDTIDASIKYINKKLQKGTQQKSELNQLKSEMVQKRELLISKTGKFIPEKSYERVGNLRKALNAVNNQLSTLSNVETLQVQQRHLISQLREFGLKESNKSYQLTRISDLKRRVEKLHNLVREQEAKQWFPFHELAQKVMNSKISTSKPFEIEIQSSNNDKVFKFRFNHISHLENAMNQEENVDSKTSSFNKDKQFFEDVKIVSLNNIGGGCNRHKLENDETTLENNKYIFKVFSPLSKDNSCAYQVIRFFTKTELSNKKICEALSLDLRAKKSIEDFKKMWDVVQSEMTFKIIDKDFQSDYDEKVNYVILHKEHYYAVKEIITKEIKEYTEVNGNGRHILTWDCETRPTDEFITIRKGCKDQNGNDLSYKSYKIKDTITSIAYMGNKGQLVKRTFITNENESSVRQFVNWLKQSKQKFKCYAHNGASFDNYFLISELTEEEFMKCKITKLGLRFAQVEFFGHNLTDSRLHLISSLERLCEDYKIPTPKLTEFCYNGRVLTNKEMCFYKPELKFWEFMQLQTTEPLFWSLYTEYCEIDCVSLYQVWEQYSKSMRSIAEAMLGNHKSKYTKDAGSYCVDKALTIGSGAMRLLEASMIKQNKDIYFKLRKFNDSEEKEEFLRYFIRGGISHTEQKGKHSYVVVDVDIASQYPSAMYIGSIPIGQSRFVENCQYDKSWCGYVKMKNVKFADHCLKNKFIATYQERADGSRALNWHTPNQVDMLYLDTITINYYVSRGDLISFDVEKALISNTSIEGKNVYGLYINTLYKLKAEQDMFKKKSDPKYNPSVRASIKLLLNSVSGKCIENKMKYEKLSKFDPARPSQPQSAFSIFIINNIGDVRKKNSKLGSLEIKKLMKELWVNLEVEIKNKYFASAEKDKIRFVEEFKAYENEKKNGLISSRKIRVNGYDFYLQEDKDLNVFLPTGLTIYSVSKILLREYVHCLPNGADDMIHAETDGFMFNKKHLESFVKNVNGFQEAHKDLKDIRSILPIAFGKQLGNLEIACESNGEPSYFLGKKNYLMAGASEGAKDLSRLKGIPQKTINDDGSDRQLVSKQDYERMFNGEKVSFTFPTLLKSTKGKVSISTHMITRSIKLDKKDFSEYI